MRPENIELNIVSPQNIPVRKKSRILRNSKGETENSGTVPTQRVPGGHVQIAPNIELYVVV
jgi:hypothetical protein